LFHKDDDDDDDDNNVMGSYKLESSEAKAGLSDCYADVVIPYSLFRQNTGVLINPWPDQEGNKLMYLSE